MPAPPAQVPGDAPPIPDDMLADLRWMAESPHAIVTMPKPVLRALLAAYDARKNAVSILYMAAGTIDHLTTGGR